MDRGRNAGDKVLAGSSVGLAGSAKISNFFDFERECLVFLLFFLVNKVAREVECTFG